MKIFISWSGALSRKIAVSLKEWLPTVIQSIDAWVSSEDIAKGSRWSSELAKALEQCDYGLICLVPNNIHEPWLNFEAGVISKSIDQGRVFPFLFGLTPEQLEGPLKLFQCTVYTKDDIHRLVLDLNKANTKDPVPTERLNKLFELCWPELEGLLNPIKHSELPVAGGKVTYLKGRNDIYAHAHQLLKSAEQRVRVVQFFGGPRPPAGYAEEAARILRAKRDVGVEVTYDAYLIISPSRIPPDFHEITQKRFDIYDGQGVGDLIGVYLLKMEYPAGFGFDMFIVDRKHAHISFTTSERVDSLQRGITFENQELVVSDLAEWFERSIERNAEKFPNLRRRGASATNL